MAILAIAILSFFLYYDFSINYYNYSHASKNICSLYIVSGSIITLLLNYRLIQKKDKFIFFIVFSYVSLILFHIIDFFLEEEGNIVFFARIFFSLFVSLESFFAFVLSNLKNKIPVIVENIDYGGHYKVIIGIDIKENYCDDIIIFADPYDKNDGKTDGYNYFYAERFYNMWFDEHCLEDNLKIQPFIAVYGKNSKK